METALNWVVWSGSVAYSMWVFSSASARVYPSLHSEDFEDGWAILNRKKDISDSEWTNVKKLFQECWPWLFGQIFLSQVFIRKQPKWLPHFYAVFSLLFFINWMGMNCTIVYVGCILIMYVVHKLGSRILCFVVGLLMLFSTNQSYFFFVRIFAAGVDRGVRGFMFDVGIGWLIAKCISFSIDKINNQTYRLSSLDDLIGVICYCLYQPTVFCGPLIVYDSFMQQLPGSNKKWDMQRVYALAIKTCRYLFSFVCLEFCLHFLYASAVQFYPDTTLKFDNWTLGGLGFCLCLLFYLKYKLIYGVCGLLAEIEGFNFPPPPKCICRVHLSSLQWRHFDRGLHLFLSKYVARPMLQYGRKVHIKIFSVFLCFSFVYVWHGMGKAIGIWSYLSCLGVLLEYIASETASTKSIQKIREKTPLWYRRISAFFSALAFLLMTISCIFFLSNMGQGMMFLHRLLGSPITFATTVVVFYAASQVSMDILKYEGK